MERHSIFFYCRALIIVTRSVLLYFHYYSDINCISSSVEEELIMDPIFFGQVNAGILNCEPKLNIQSVQSL